MLHIFVVQTHTLWVRQLTDLQHPHYTSRYQLSTLHSPAPQTWTPRRQSWTRRWGRRTSWRTCASRTRCRRRTGTRTKIVRWIRKYFSNIQGVPYYWAHFVFVIFSVSRADTDRGGQSGGAGGAQATPGILIFQKQVTPCHQIRWHTWAWVKTHSLKSE